MKSRYILAAAIAASIQAGNSQAQSAQPSAADEAADAGGIAEVMVVAQRRSERLQDVPISVQAMSGASLAANGVDNIQELPQLVPSLNVTNAVGFTITYLRGVGSTAIGPGIENPVAIYLDGVYYASTTSSLFDLTNIDHVEVLKGPQGTLFGRNATGGLIQVITRDPDQNFHVNAHVGYGNYQTLKGDAYVSGGIADNLAADMFVQVSRMGEGYGRNLYDGNDVYRENYNTSLRSKWIFTPTDTTKITAIGDYTDTSNSMNAHRLAIGTGSNPAFGNPAQGGDEWDQNTDQDPKIHNENAGVSLKLDQETRLFNVSDIVAYRESSTRLQFDADYTSVPFLKLNLIDLENQVSNEFQLSSLVGSKLKWTAGLYYFHGRGQYAPAEVNFADPALNPVAPLQYISTYGDQRTFSVAGYGQASYEIFDATNLTLGGRYTHESRHLYGSEYGLLPDGTSIGALVPNIDAEIDFNKPTYRVALDHRFSEELLAYASFNTGFKSGGFNTQTPTDPAYKPEELKAYEIGVKTNLLDRRLVLDTAVFAYDYLNIQVPKIGLSAVGIINGARARIYGAEADLQFEATDRLTLNGGAGYTHARFASFPDAPTGVPEGGVPVISADASGHAIPMTPLVQGNVNGTYRFDVGSGELLVNSSLTYNSGYYLEADNIFHQGSFIRLNSGVTWKPTENYSIKLWANNLTDKAIIKYSGTIADGSRNVSYDAPRTFGITFEYKL